MGRNSKDNSMGRYEQLAMISIRYSDYARFPHYKMKLSSKNRGELPQSVKYINDVKNALNKINPVHREFVIKEFFDKNRNQYWWADRYSKSTYYRIRSIAIKNFLEEFQT